MGARQTMAAVESALADRAPHAPARRAPPLDGIRRGAVGLALALAASLLVLYGLARLGAIGTNASQIAQSNAALAIAVWQGDGGTLQAVASPQGGLAIYRNAQRIAWIRGHSAAIVSAAFVDNGRAVLTLDANGQSRLTRLDTAPALAAFEVAPALKALNQGLWQPYGAPVAQAVSAMPWNPIATALPSALVSLLLGLGAFAGPQALAFAGRLRPKPRQAQASDAPAPRAFQPPRTPGSRWREPILGLRDNAFPDMVTIPAGRFLMGAAEGEKAASADEYPQHEVTIPAPFTLGRTPVTFAQWDATIAAGAKLPKLNDEGWGRGARPVINVSWEDTQAYLAWLNAKLGLNGAAMSSSPQGRGGDTAAPIGPYRLPSEAEWEYACRAGSTTRWSFGDDENELGDHAWFSSNAGGKTHPVGQKSPNAFGLHDMHGNVWEWCEDSFQNNYEGAPADGSGRIGKNSSNRVFRGGSSDSNPAYLRSAYRSWNSPSVRSNYLGFRVARTL